MVGNLIVLLRLRTCRRCIWCKILVQILLVQIQIHIQDTTLLARYLRVYMFQDHMYHILLFSYHLHMYQHDIWYKTLVLLWLVQIQLDTQDIMLHFDYLQVDIVQDHIVNRVHCCCQF